MIGAAIGAAFILAGAAIGISVAYGGRALGAAVALALVSLVFLVSGIGFVRWAANVAISRDRGKRAGIGDDIHRDGTPYTTDEVDQLIEGYRKKGGRG